MDDTSEFEAASKDWFGFKFIQRKGLFNSVGARINSVLFFSKCSQITNQIKTLL